MSVQAPPYAVWSPLERRLPGVWRRFLPAANRALRASGGRPSSWYRTPAQNAAVGGAPQSQHLVGVGLDVTGGYRTAQAFRREGFIVVQYRRHIHAQLYPAGTLRALRIL